MIPAGPEEFEAACQACSRRTGSPILGSGDDDILGTAWVWASLLAQNGGSPVDDDGMPSVDTPEALEALNTFLRLREEGCIGTGELGSHPRGLHQRRGGQRHRRHLDRSTSGTRRWPTRTPP